MDLKITAEWLLSFDSDYEPSGLMTPNDRIELERRRAERLNEQQAADSAEKAHLSARTTIAAK